MVTEEFQSQQEMEDWSTMSQHGPSMAMGGCVRQESYVATRFPRRQGGLGHDRDFSIATKSCWPRVATRKAMS